MSAGVLTLAPVIARLEAASTPFREIGGAVDYDAAIEGALTTPAAWVVPVSESAGPNRLAGGCAVSQAVVARFMVLILARDLRRGDGLSELETSRISVIEALVGWVHPDARSGAVSGAGRLMADIGEGGLIVWGQEFAVGLDRRATREPT